MSKIKSLFLGPQAENLEFFEKIISDIVKDNAFLRRNYQVDDQLIITEQDKLSDDYINAISEFHNHLKIVLNQLKKSVPTYHPRHIGHMNADVMMSGVAGFMSALLYNPNNIINIASPASTLMEIEYIDSLCSMIGFPSIARSNKDKMGSWGHLCSGGTSANIEALWILRNLKYFPVTIKIVAKAPDYKFLNSIKIGTSTIKELSFNELFNIPISETYPLLEKVRLSFSDGLKSDKVTVHRTFKSDIDFYEKAILPYTVQYLGVAGIHKACTDLGENLNFPKVYIARTSHYSWDKAMDIVGLGRGNLVKIEVDQDFRLDITNLKQQLESDDNAILAVVNIMGSTEEGAFDPLLNILELRKQTELNLGKSFFVHVDGAYGGYFASCIDYKRQLPYSGSEFKEFLISVVRSEEISMDDQVLSQSINEYFSFDTDWYQNVLALKDVDSITIDPHKLGYIPYPAGAIVFRDYRSREHISFDAPYVTNENSQDLSAIYLGQWTLEGSRPGASAVACYLSEKVLPLVPQGHGTLLGCTIIGAIRLLSAIEKFNSPQNCLNKGYQILPLFKGDSNIVCYIVSNPKFIKSPTLLNIFTDAVFKAFAIDTKRIIPDFKFILSNSLWDYKNYRRQINTILAAAGIDESKFSEMEGEKLEYIRSVMLNPLTAFVSPTFYDEYLEMIGEIADGALSNALLTLLSKQNNGERLNILWIENEINLKELKDKFEQDISWGRYFNVDFEIYPSPNSIENILNRRDYFVAIVDLNLVDRNHQESANKESGYKVIKELKKLNFTNILSYSEYLSETNPCFKEIHTEMTTDADVDILLPESCLIGKTHDFERDKLSIIYAIFELLQI